MHFTCLALLNSTSSYSCLPRGWSCSHAGLRSTILVYLHLHRGLKFLWFLTHLPFSTLAHCYASQTPSLAHIFASLWITKTWAKHSIIFIFNDWWVVANHQNVARTQKVKTSQRVSKKQLSPIECRKWSIYSYFITTHCSSKISKNSLLFQSWSKNLAKCK